MSSISLPGSDFDFDHSKLEPGERSSISLSGSIFEFDYRRWFWSRGRYRYLSRATTSTLSAEWGVSEKGSGFRTPRSRGRLSVSLPGSDFFSGRQLERRRALEGVVLIALRRAPWISREVVRRRAQAFLMARTSAVVEIKGRPRGRRGRGVPQNDRRQFPGPRRRLVSLKG